MRNPCPHPSQLLFWVDGSMPPDEAERTAQHAAGCHTCSERVAMLRSTVLGQAGRPPVHLQSGFAPTVPPSRNTPAGLTPGIPSSGKLGSDMAPTTPFIRAEPEEPEGERSRSPTQDLRGPGAPAKDPGRPEKLQPGDTLGRFVVLAKQGSGGMGVVYAAYDPELDRKVALKILRSDADRSMAAELRTRLIREAQAMARLSHPNVIPVYDVGTVGTQVFLAMEFVEGTTLTKHQRALPADRARWRAVLALYLQAGRGLAAAHAAGLIHRDFKPDNVLVSRDGQVRVVDFGLARPEGTAVESEPGGPGDGARPPSHKSGDRPGAGRAGFSGKAALDTPLTQSGVLVGTPAYMPPEQLTGSAVDGRTDQFSFCVALWEALHGERPFRGSSAQELGEAIASGRLPAPAPATKVPARLRRILARGLSADASQRYSSMESLLADLQRDPAVVQRRALAGAVALLVVGASVGAGTYASRRARDLCKGSEARLAGLWDAPRKAALKEAVLRTKLPFALQVWASTEPVVDAYASRWVKLRTDVCEATRVRGDQSEQLLDLRIRCLDRRLDEMAAYLALLDAGDAKVIEQAVQAAQSFTDPRSCQLAQATEQLPENAEARASTVKARKALSEAKALGDAAVLSGALAQATTAVDEARKGGHKPTLAEALAALGDLKDRTGDSGAAIAMLQEAATTADAAQQDMIRAQAMIGLSLAVFRAGRPEESVAWGQLANAALARAGGDDALQARLHHVLALALQAMGRPDDAVAHFTRCVDLRQRAFGTDAFVVAASLQAFGSALHQQGRLDMALQQLRKAADLKRQALGASHPEVGQARRALGLALWAKGELKAALNEQRAAEEILTHSGADDALGLSQLSSEMARTLRGLGKNAEALGQQRAALSRLETALGQEHPAVAEALLDLAELQIDTGRPKDALPLIARSERLSERRAGTDSPLRARASIDLGRVHLVLGRASIALTMARSAQDRLERAGGPPALALRASLLVVESLWAGGQKAAAVAEAKRAQASLAPKAPADPAAGQLKQWLAARG